MTSWIPLGTIYFILTIVDQGMRTGTLGVVLSSHNYNFTTKEEGVELPSDFRKHVKSCTWGTQNFKQGDVLLFKSKCVHGSFK